MLLTLNIFETYSVHSMLFKFAAGDEFILNQIASDICQLTSKFIITVFSEYFFFFYLNNLQGDKTSFKNKTKIIYAGGYKNLEYIIK